MNETERLIDALTRLNEAAVTFRAGRTGINARNDAIVDASAAGATPGQISTCVGVSKKRVWQILLSHSRSVPEDGHETA